MLKETSNKTISITRPKNNLRAPKATENDQENTTQIKPRTDQAKSTRGRNTPNKQRKTSECLSKLTNQNSKTKATKSTCSEANSREDFRICCQCWFSIFGLFAVFRGTKGFRKVREADRQKYRTLIYHSFSLRSGSSRGEVEQQMGRARFRPHFQLQPSFILQHPGCGAQRNAARALAKLWQSNRTDDKEQQNTKKSKDWL